MTDMFFQVLFIIVICLGIFLCASWFFSCLFTEWQLDAVERARKKQAEELQVVKEQDPVNTNFIEETAIVIDDIQKNKKNKKQNFVQLSDATLPSNQALSSVYPQGNDNKKNKMTSSQKQQQQNHQMQQASQIKQQFPNLTLQEIQQHQIKQMQQQAAQQRQIEQIKQQFLNINSADIRQLQQLQVQQALNTDNNLNNSTSNSVTINLANVNNAMNAHHQVTEVIPTTVETPSAVDIVVEPENEQSMQKKAAVETAITAEIEKIERDILPEKVQQLQQSVQQQQQQQQQKQQNQSNQQQINIQQQPVVSTLSDGDIIKELNLADKMPYRERKLEEYEFFKTALEIFDLSRNLEVEKITESYARQYENAINEADAKRTKINWQSVPLLHANDHLTAIEEISVLLDQFLTSKFFKKINRHDKTKVIDQLLRSVLNIITKRLKFRAKTKEHQDDLLWIWNEIKDHLEKEKLKIKAPKSAQLNKPALPPKPSNRILYD